MALVVNGIYIYRLVGGILQPLLKSYAFDLPAGGRDVGPRSPHKAHVRRE